MNKGVLCAVGAYLAWGLFPIYWKALHQIPPLELICHRIVWSCVTLYIILALRGGRKPLLDAIRKPKVVGTYLVAALLIGVNWLVFVWGVNSGFVIETSLGYFINPLLSVLLGVFIFRERLRPLQWAAVALAGAAVIYLTLVYGAVPRIALALALSFSLYGVVKKVAPLGAVHGLALETSLLLLPGIGCLAMQAGNGNAASLHASPVTLMLLLCSGLVTIFPLTLFAAASQRIPLAQIGILQYIAPTLQFLLGALVFRERFTPAQFGGFGLVWFSLALFAIEGGIHHRSKLPAAAEPVL